jgi:hypothetical protein
LPTPPVAPASLALEQLLVPDALFNHAPEQLRTSLAAVLIGPAYSFRQGHASKPIYILIKEDRYKSPYERGDASAPIHTPTVHPAFPGYRIRRPVTALAASSRLYP